MILRVSKEYLNDVKKDSILRGKILIIVNFLISRGSTIGFLVREEFF